MARRLPPATPAPDAPGGRHPDAFRPTTRRRQLLLAVLAVATVSVIAALMLRPHQQLMGAKAARADAARALACPSGAASATPGCPGGRMDVMVLPAVPASPR
ncbi:MAG: hypothetical protein QE285_05105 [Aquabacterium sp.]|nr:hypothetical protein [Aquabacterium sp.]